MELLEYQAKALFADVGIPILPSQRIYQPRDIKQLQVPYPVVLKSQVRAGGRAKAGGIRFVENTIDAIAATQTILTLAIAGEYPQLVLAEARYDTDQELFLAIVLDYHRQHPILLGSARGGIEVDLALEDIQTVVIEQEFSPFHARRLAIQMGLTGPNIQAVSSIVEKMYHLFASKDLDSIEINPLGINPNGEVMALDGKITLSETALSRHPQLQTLSDLPIESRYAATPMLPTLPCWEQASGAVAILSPNPGVAALIWDNLTKTKTRPQYCALIDPQGDIAQQMTVQLNACFERPSLKAVVIHLCPMAEIATAMIAALTQSHPGLPKPPEIPPRSPRRRSSSPPAQLLQPAVVVYVPGQLSNEASQALGALPLQSVTTLADLLTLLMLN
ncbi:ATP-grasp domain-containing protein [Spirulina sp. CCNP1310]|uniref:ATP-grasp domain-containing protein n=1 Tax=Spirulina sp. CCNP1310 TaxID=3110249 RepID=UPI002B220039|nr:ATP-grasp domain-containing protein [Spirulina sp. CCNP1310]MEA5418987.1 ATP-grasp domain-containing protein [Spirulina sp. CCNP1310]